jgi:uncharacterized cupredoxin-like copper-binding protein
MPKLRTGLSALVALVALVTLGAQASATPAAQTATTVTVSAGKPSEFAFKLSKTTIPAGVVHFKVTNDGTIVHDFDIAGKKTKLLSPGQSQTITVNFKKAGSFRYLCTVPGHAAAGMKGVLKVRASSSAALKLDASLNARKEVPRPTGALAKATGRFTATLNGRTLKWRLTFSHLSGPAISAHIHLAKAGKAGPVMVPLCAPCSSPKSGTAMLTQAQVNASKNGRTYVNVHTKKNPNGEIRGQITRAV